MLASLVASIDTLVRTLCGMRSVTARQDCDKSDGRRRLLTELHCVCATHSFEGCQLLGKVSDIR